MLCVGTSFNCDAQNGFRFLHRDMQIAAVVRYDIGAVLNASGRSVAAPAVHPVVAPSPVRIVHRHMIAVLAQGEPLHRLVASHVAVAAE